MIGQENTWNYVVAGICMIGIVWWLLTRNEQEP
jgi:LPXTG-motif cell wall-anchored protein